MKNKIIYLILSSILIPIIPLIIKVDIRLYGWVIAIPLAITFYLFRKFNIINIMIRVFVFVYYFIYLKMFIENYEHIFNMVHQIK